MNNLYLNDYMQLLSQSHQVGNDFFAFSRYYILVNHIKRFLKKNIEVKGRQWPDY